MDIKSFKNQEEDKYQIKEEVKSLFELYKNKKEHLKKELYNKKVNNVDLFSNIIFSTLTSSFEKIFKDANYNISKEISPSLKVNNYTVNICALPHTSNNSDSFITFGYLNNENLNNKFDSIGFKVHQIGKSDNIIKFNLHIDKYTQLIKKSLFINISGVNRPISNFIETNEMDYLTKIKEILEIGIKEVDASIEFLKNDNDITYFFTEKNAYGRVDETKYYNMEQLIECL